MLNDLFTNPNEDEKPSKSYSKKSHGNLSSKPMNRRKKNNLCGIVNQGATCYLNTLIQTLYFTPEFRANLYDLSEEELGLVPSTNQKVKVRVILIELQRLFANLQLADLDACSTNRLTDSFGWLNNEEMQQHDVQELNRILFAAIEKSLVNTKQAKLIQELYRGTYVNKIRCLSCLNVFEREEEFLDIPITVQGSNSLWTSLDSSFISREQLNGNNQYRCEKCNNQYCDAEKYCQLKNLPPILTFSLLRFTYDLRTFQRIKETGFFEFPFECNLRKYLEDSFMTTVDESYSEYELYSVIIHSGNAYGGHYHTYIRDFDGLGKWHLNKSSSTSNISKLATTAAAAASSTFDQTKAFCDELLEDSKLKHGDNSEIKLICSAELEPDFDEQCELVNLDFSKYDSPLELCRALVYNRYKYEQFNVENLLHDLNRSVLNYWNKQFGPMTISEFIEQDQYRNVFKLNYQEGIGMFAKLAEHDRINIVSSSSCMSEQSGEELIQSCLDEVNDSLPDYFDLFPRREEHECSEHDDSDEQVKESPDSGSYWFDFDDSRVTPINHLNEMAKQYEGRESAYMLFYRRKQPKRTDRVAQVPVWLRLEIERENESLNARRENYQVQLNQYSIDCFIESDFQFINDIITLDHVIEKKPLTLMLDKRSTKVIDLDDILRQAVESGDENRKAACLSLLNGRHRWQVASRLEASARQDDCVCYMKAKLNADTNVRVYDQVMSSSNSSYHSSKSILVLVGESNEWPIGDNFMPIRLTMKLFNKQTLVMETSLSFVKIATTERVKKLILDFLSVSSVSLDDSQQDLQFSFMHRSFLVQNEKLKFSEINEKKSLDDLSLKNDDFVIVESNVDVGEETPAYLYDTQLSQPKAIGYYNDKEYQVKIVKCLGDEEKTLSTIDDLALNVVVFRISSLDPISQMKVIAFTCFNLDSTKIDELAHLRYANSECIGENEWLSRLVNISLDDKESFSHAKRSIPAWLNMNYVGVPMHDDMKIGEISNINSLGVSNHELVFLLCPGRAPIKEKNELSLRCSYEANTMATMELTREQVLSEIIVNADVTTIGELTQMVIDKMHLKPIDTENEKLEYLMKTTNWLGDADAVLNEVTLSCRDAHLRHGQYLLVGKGKRVPQNHLKIRIWFEKRPEESVEETTNAKASENDTLVPLKELVEENFKRLQKIEEIVVSYDKKLRELKELIVVDVLKPQKLLPMNTIDNNEEDAVDLEALVRLRQLRKVFKNDDLNSNSHVRFLKRKALLEDHKTLRQLHFVPEVDVCVQLVDTNEIKLNQGIVLLNCAQMDLKTKQVYKSTYKEIAWNVNNGATLQSLKDSIVKAYTTRCEPSDAFSNRLHIAKRLMERFQWILLKDCVKPSSAQGGSSKISEYEQSESSTNKPKSKASNKKSNKASSSIGQANLKIAPFSLDDGDLIVFSLDDSSSSTIEAKDFMSEEDLAFSKRKNLSTAEIARLSAASSASSAPKSDSYSNKRNHRAEVGIKIDIDDY